MSAPNPTPDLQGGLAPAPEMRTLKDLTGETSFAEYLAKVRDGLKQPKDSGEYKYAIHQVVRVWSPIAGVVLPVLLVVAVLLAPEHSAPPATAFTVTMVEPDALNDVLEDIEEIKQPEDQIEEIEPPPLEDFKPEDIVNMTDDQLVGGPAGPAGPGSSTSASTAEFSPQPAAFDTVAMIKSPIKMSGIFSSRNPGARGKALAAYGGGGGAGGAATEHAVYLALRWLKKYQEPDGSWVTGAGGGENQYGGCKPAMTALALLSYLAHGETPESEEFGPTVERAIKWMVDNQEADGHFKGRDNHDYSQPIVTYALSEAFALTRIPMVKAAAEKATTVLVKGQNPVGSLWNYNFDPKAELKAGSPATERGDLSYAAWCMQALKAAGMAGLEVEGLEEAKRKAVEGTKRLRQQEADGSARFGYSYTVGVNGPWEITGAGVLCLQLLGAGKSKEAQDGLNWLKRTTFEWDKPWMLDTDKDGKPIGNPIYHWYYITQAKFHAGGGTWADWNKQFSPQLVRNQVIIQNGISDPTGKLVDIGYWKPATPSEFCQSYVYNTTLCSLMLQVYYRYLPTFKTPEDAAEEATTLSSDDVDVEVL